MWARKNRCAVVSALMTVVVVALVWTSATPSPAAAERRRDITRNILKPVPTVGAGGLFRPHGKAAAAESRGEPEEAGAELRHAAHPVADVTEAAAAIVAAAGGAASFDLKKVVGARFRSCPG
uniref:Uncharacterized protein n=1 Tax=Neobodo designis TaxID=312471 RepID=A0A7S1LH02_NEODS|mmetsp:Transcript_21993/g.68254  ORF Transcript_21993/g.68254 Transcript_21993/m.68254 type:complete len:122 (+) Transcript_21993:88-453(+)